MSWQLVDVTGHGSNLRPHPCHGCALPAELHARPTTIRSTAGLADRKHLNEYPIEIPLRCTTGCGTVCLVGQPLLAVPCSLGIVYADSQEWLSYSPHFH